MNMENNEMRDSHFNCIIKEMSGEAVLVPINSIKIGIEGTIRD